MVVVVVIFVIFISVIVIFVNFTFVFVAVLYDGIYTKPSTLPGCGGLTSQEESVLVPAETG